MSFGHQWQQHHTPHSEILRLRTGRNVNRPHLGPLRPELSKIPRPSLLCVVSSGTSVVPGEVGRSQCGSVRPGRGL